MNRRGSFLPTPLLPLLLALFGLSACQSLREMVVPGDSYLDLGNFHYKVTTSSDEAQTWFDRGLLLCYGFNHEEAIRCFERAATADPHCAMVYWGIAYASGPNFNNTEMDEEAAARAYENSRKAADLASIASAVERRLISALGHRYADPDPEDRHPLDVAWADAMREVHADYPGDADVAALFAESLMNLRPWKLWSPAGKPAPETPEIVKTLEGALARAPHHPALCHFYIHTMEPSPNPEKALPAANRLRNAAPDAGHLVHMPSHIDVLVGNYAEVIETNRRAIIADQKYLKREGGMNFYTLYRIHNYHFLVYGAMFDGQSRKALKYARELVEQIPEPLLADWTDFLDAFVPTPYHVMVRFGQWGRILAEPKPRPDLPVTLAIWHYARGLAYAATGDVAKAEVEKREFDQARRTVPESSILFNNASSDILNVAGAMLEGEVAYRRRNFDQAFDHLREAVRLDDALNYDEPWGWMQPARHALGALLLEQGRIEEAEATYRTDLEKHPLNPWSLHGLAECQRRSGQHGDAHQTEEQLRQALIRADVEIGASCYCRVGMPNQ